MTDSPQHYDALIIGTGQAGVPLAKDLAKAGWKTAIVEAAQVGGSCVNYGCTPTKTLLASAQVAQSAREAANYGITVSKVDVDLEKVKDRRDKLVMQSRESNVEALEDSEAHLIRGKASFEDKTTVRIALNEGGTAKVTADKIFINTGTTPVIPAIDGLDSIDYLTYKTIQDLTETPEHLLILGGGYIGLEFGQMFRRFGSKVTLLQHGKQLLSREDEDVAQCMKEILEDEGIQVLVDVEPQSVKKENGKLQLQVKKGDGTTEVFAGSHLLIATGVKANTADLELEKAGIATDKKGNIEASPDLKTSTEGIYAMGDVKGGPQFTHISYDDYRILRDQLLHHGKRTTNDRPVPYCVFTEPQVGRIGITEKQAKEQQINYKVAKLPVSSVARASETGHSKGFYKVLVNPDNKYILGAAIIAPEGGEIMSMLQLAMMGNLTYTQLRDGVFAHPTYAESLNNLFMSLD
ncbi:mercuric reductase [Pontibacter rugosus]|uniref:Mercuric reductase n=1 Tax=Pontibacter rugosus TaxID=1745966 RepID=A0ABW3SNE9_9BACT